MRRSVIWKHLVPGIAIAVAALYLTYRKADPAALLDVLGGMRWQLLLLVVPPLALSYIFRVLRWRILLSHMEKISSGAAAGPLITGFFVNTLLPARVGELLRALLLSRKTSIPRASSFGTVVLARLFDGLTLAAMTLVVMVVLRNRLETATRVGLMGAGLLYVLVLGVLISLRMFREKAAAAVAFPLRRLGMGSLSVRVEGMLISFAEGLETLRDWKDTLRAAALSLLVWSSLAVSVIPVFLSMNLELQWHYPLLVLVLAGLGMLIPTPAGTGTVHGALVLVLPGLIGVSVEDTRVLALLFHSTQFIPLLVVGFAFALREGVTASQIGRIADSGGRELG